MLPPAKISGTTLEHAIIAECSIIHAKKIEHSVIGIRSRIGLDTVISNCYIMGSDYYETLEDIKNDAEKGIPKIGIGERCQFKNVIMDKDCRVGDDVHINGGAHLPDSDHFLYTVKDGIVVLKKGAIVPDGFVI